MKKSRVEKLQLNNAGMTLTELVVAFALLGIFMVAAMRMISYSINLYYVNRGETYGLEVSDMISEKIIGMLEGAEADDFPVITAVGGDAATNGSTIYFRDKSSSMVTIGVDGSTGTEGQGYVVIHYDELIDDDETIAHDAVDWKFDPKAYMGYTVKRLSFEEGGDSYDGYVLIMTLELENARYGDYQTKYLIKCNNIDPDDKPKAESAAEGENNGE